MNSGLWAIVQYALKAPYSLLDISFHLSFLHRCFAKNYALIYDSCYDNRETTNTSTHNDIQ